MHVVVEEKPLPGFRSAPKQLCFLQSLLVTESYITSFL